MALSSLLQQWGTLFIQQEGRYIWPGAHNTILGGVGGVLGRYLQSQTSLLHQQTVLLPHCGEVSSPHPSAGLVGDGLGGLLSGSASSDVTVCLLSLANLRISTSVGSLGGK